MYKGDEISMLKDICTHMFIAALLTIAKEHKRPVSFLYSSNDDQMMNKEKVVYMHHEKPFNLKKGGNLIICDTDGMKEARHQKINVTYSHSWVI
jgi:hypothetical protein